MAKDWAEAGAKVWRALPDSLCEAAVLRSVKDDGTADLWVIRDGHLAKAKSKRSRLAPRDEETRVDSLLKEDAKGWSRDALRVENEKPAALHRPSTSR